jgi:transposase
LQALEAQLAETLAVTGLAEALLSVPGIGVITAAGFLAEIGDVAHYRHYRQLQKLAGLNLTEQSSGEQRGQRTISKRGRPGLRRVLYQMALGLICNNAEFKALYQRLRTRSHNPLANTPALVAIMSKALRMLFYLAKNRERYDGSKAPGNAGTAVPKLAA